MVTKNAYFVIDYSMYLALHLCQTVHMIDISLSENNMHFYDTVIKEQI
jgi:hypothetical protein